MWKQVFIDSIKALVPFKNSIRAAKRRLFPYRSLSENDELAFKQGLEIIRQAQALKCSFGTVLEVGTGWVPTIPSMFHAAGASKIYLTDVERLLDERTYAQAKDFVGGRLQEISETMFRPLPVVRKQFEKPPNFKYLCPFDPQVIGPESVDIAYSRTVLEHIDPNTLQQLLSDIFNLLKSGGITIHIIDNSDHFEHRNRSLSQVDFLRYSDRLWRLTHFNAQNYQNRLRHSDYLPIFEGAGFDVIEFSGEPGATALEDIKRMKLAPRFRRYDAEDLAILTTYVAARKPLL